MGKAWTNGRLDRLERECIASAVGAVNRFISGIYDEALRPLGVTAGQLAILVRAANCRRARSADLCRAMLLDASTLSRTLERMRERGWLEEVSGEDSRARPFRVTARGLVMLRKAIPAWERAQREAAAFLGEGCVTTIRRSASKIGSRGTRGMVR